MPLEFAPHSLLKNKTSALLSLGIFSLGGHLVQALLTLFNSVLVVEPMTTTEARGRDDIPLILEGKKVVFNRLEWNLPPLATH
jgi:hypothetical protein